MSSIETWTVNSGGFNPLILQVNKDFDKAKKVVEDYRNEKFKVRLETLDKYVRHWNTRQNVIQRKKRFA